MLDQRFRLGRKLILLLRMILMQRAAISVAMMSSLMLVIKQYPQIITLVWVPVRLLG